MTAPAVAIHEAAHAAFGALLRLQMESASIVPDARTAGRVRFAFPTPEDLRGRVSWAMVLVAPRFAEVRHGIEHNAGVHADDTARLVQVLEPYHQGDRERAARAVQLVGEATLRLIDHPAMASAVERLAGELARQKESAGPWLALLSRFDGALPHDLAETEIAHLQRRLAMPTPRLEVSQARVLKIDERTRTIRHVISTAALDRRNRIVDVGGWDLANYKRNPIVFADHDYAMEKVIGRGLDVKVEGDALVATTEFDTEGLGNVAFRLVQAGLVRAWSVGWQGLAAHSFGDLKRCAACDNAMAAGRQWGTHYTAQELLEYSLVTIPANPDAVMGLQAAGLVAKVEAEEWNDLVGRRRAGRSDSDLVAAIEDVSREIQLHTARLRMRL